MPPRDDRSRASSDPDGPEPRAADARGTDRSRVGGTTRSTGRGGRGTRAAGTRGAGRVRARGGPRRDSRRVLRRRAVTDEGTERSGAAGRARRAARAARVTGGALGLSTARRAAVLAVVVCALALTVAVPLRNYVTQRHELAAVAEQQRRLRTEVDALAAERAALADPAHVEALARERLGYARPGETPYRVELPGDATASARERDAAVAATLPPSEAELPWYDRVARTTLGTAS